MSQRYMIIHTGFKKKRDIKFNFLSTSPEWWKKLQERAKKDDLKITYRSETVNGIKQVYYAIIDYPYDYTEEYYLMSSKKNKSMVAKFGGVYANG